MTIRTILIAFGIAIGMILLPNGVGASACGFAAEATETISMSIGGNRSANVNAYIYTGSETTQDELKCYASVQVPLSAFPSFRLRTRTEDVANTMRDLAEQWGFERCQVTVMVENDLTSEIDEDELCTTNVFGFAGRSVWANDRDESCYTR